MTDPIVFAGYMLLHRLGAGGMAEAWLARSVRMGAGGREVVLKRMLPRHLSDPVIKSEFLNEARLLSLFSHQNLIEVIDLGEEDGAPYLVLEYIRGCDLGTLISRAALIGAKMGEETSLYIMTELLEGLGAIHSAAGKDGKNLEIIHGDINPANIFISYDGAVKIGDFGIARTAGDRQGAAKGIVKGKVGYLAPEQVVEAPVDTRVDLFAAGIVMWELLAGRRLYEQGRTREIMTQIRRDPPPPLSLFTGISNELENIVMKALEKDPGKRFQCAAEFSGRIAAYAEGAGRKPQFGGLRSFIQKVFKDRMEDEKRTIDAALRHAGRIEERSLPRVFIDLMRENADGVLTVESGADRRNVYIRRGSLMFATSTMQSELFGEYLLSEGVINEEELVAALAKSRELGLRIGETLVTMGMLAPTKLIEVLQDQVRNKIINLFSWIEGAYIFRPGGKFPEDSIRLKIPTPRLVLDGVIEHMPADRIEEVLGPMMDRRPVVEFDVLVNEDSLALHPRQYRVLRAIMSSETLGKALDSVTGFGTVPRKTAISIAYVLHEAGVLKFV